MFGVPMVWREPKDHSTDCYFCLTDIKGRNRKGKKSIVYPDLQSAIRPVLHSSDIPVPQPPSELPSDDTSNSDDLESQDATYTTQLESDKKPHLITQPELNDLVRDLTLTKQQSELLASRLQQWHLLDEEARITVFRKRSANLQDFFTLENNLTYCNDIRSLFSAPELSYEPNERAPSRPLTVVKQLTDGISDVGRLAVQGDSDWQWTVAWNGSATFFGWRARS
ncbi:uncharacterized protein LOC143039025 [Oratosquilla oratoria]|uniref:uncharacterized protein LOC143039025 n=1 Tax=Oratosquilla oratoria TaxID=337810 RepID=UPI003F758295